MSKDDAGRPPIEEVYEDATKEERKWALNHCAQILQEGADEVR